MTILPMAKAIAVIVQGVRRKFFLNMVLKNEDILPPKIEQAFEAVSLWSTVVAVGLTAQK